MRLRSGWPLALFVVLLVAVPILEVYVLVQVGQRIGVAADGRDPRGRGGPRRLADAPRGRRAWRALDGAFRGGRIPTGELADARWSWSAACC